MKFFDLHCDTLSIGAFKNLPFDGKATAVDFFDRTPEKYVQTFAAFIPDETENGFADFLCMCEYMEKSGIKPAVCPDDLNGKRAAIFAVENGKGLNGDINNLDFMYKKGVRMLTLTWNGKNLLGSGCAKSGGLTDFGREVICRMNTLKMATDLSHINREGFSVAAELAFYPVASHSCFNGKTEHRRNLTDEQAKLIAQKDGIIGVSVYPDFMGEGHPFERFAEQVKYGIDLGLKENLAIGTDFDGGVMHPELARTEHIWKLYTYLEKELGAETCEALFYNNAAKFFNRLLTN